MLEVPVNLDNIVGNKYGRLEVTSFFGFSSPPSGGKQPKWNCSCECGNTIVAFGTNLKRENHTTSCGCVQKERTSKARKTHGLTESITYNTWLSMKERCLNVNSHSYPLYGGTGIKICDRWLYSFENFLEDMGERLEGTTLNRMRGASVYSKETCEWANRSIQGYDQKKKNTNKSGRTGVCWNKIQKQWSAQIMKDKKQHHLGFFDDIGLAIKARENAEIKYFGWTKE